MDKSSDIPGDVTAWEKVLIELLQPRGRANVVECDCHSCYVC